MNGLSIDALSLVLSPPIRLSETSGKHMKRLRILRRWFKRRFGYARLVCLVLLIGLAALRIADPAPVEELRVRTFDSFQRVHPRVKKARPVPLVEIHDKSLAKLGQ